MLPSAIKCVTDEKCVQLFFTTSFTYSFNRSHATRNFSDLCGHNVSAATFSFGVRFIPDQMFHRAMYARSFSPSIRSNTENGFSRVPLTPKKNAVSDRCFQSLKTKI